MSAKDRIIKATRTLVRKIGFEGGADYVKYMLQRVRRARVNGAYRRTHPNLALPPPYMLYEAYNLDYQNYIEDGLDTAKSFARYIRPYVRKPGSKFLDWGCGPARLLRHIPASLPAACDVHGVDVNPATVAWCQASLPELDVQLSSISPPLPYETGSLSAVLGLSVLTHLSVEAHCEWLAEMYRVLRPGGALVVTTHGDAFRQRLSREELGTYEQQVVFARSYRQEGHRLYGAYHPPNGFRAIFHDWFVEREHVAGTQEKWGIQQDLWILERTGKC